MSSGEKETKTKSQATGSVLIVEDDQDDAKLLHRELTLAGVRQPIHAVTCGEHLFCYLRGEGQYQDREKFPYPVLVLLDLRMSPRDGYEVLRWLNSNPKYSTFPVVVVSVVEEQNKIFEAYRLGAKTFLRKPISREDLREALQALDILPVAKT